MMIFFVLFFVVEFQTFGNNREITNITQRYKDTLAWSTSLSVRHSRFVVVVDCCRCNSSETGQQNFLKGLGPRTAKLALSIYLNMKMVKRVTERGNSANGSLLISCL